MDTYQGSIFDPVSLHKYLYANANPVMNVDPSGYATLTGQQVAVAGIAVMASAVLVNDTWAMNVYHNLKNTFAENSYFSPKYIFHVDDIFIMHIASGLLTSAEANEEISAEITSDATSGTGAAAPDPKNNKNKKNKKKKDDKNYKNYDPEEIEKKYGLEEGEFHNKIKPIIKSIAEQIKNKSGTDKKIVRFVKQNTNPDILFSRNGYIALQSRQTKELIALGITIFELLSKE